jgi:ABC-type Fe3+ transport system permease subunit
MFWQQVVGPVLAAAAAVAAAVVQELAMKTMLGEPQMSTMTTKQRHNSAPCTTAVDA